MRKVQEFTALCWLLLVIVNWRICEPHLAHIYWKTNKTGWKYAKPHWGNGNAKRSMKCVFLHMSQRNKVTRVVLAVRVSGGALRVLERGTLFVKTMSICRQQQQQQQSDSEHEPVDNSGRARDKERDNNWVWQGEKEAHKRKEKDKTQYRACDHFDIDKTQVGSRAATEDNATTWKQLCRLRRHNARLTNTQFLKSNAYKLKILTYSLRLLFKIR